MKQIRRFWQTATAFGLAALPTAVLAQAKNPFQTAGELTGKVAKTANVGEQQELPVIVGNIINILLGFLGIVLLAYLLYGGFLW
ncbi:hypothetical protein HY479_00005, partial [Candidatus Uhrbacteria bacterium]|nr:hypothetical protein [Candidatus Uhrbacteria bacterium]